MLRAQLHVPSCPYQVVVVAKDTCVEAKRFFNKYISIKHSKAVEKIFIVRGEFKSAEKRRLENEQRNIMHQVGVEFMSYAAINRGLNSARTTAK